MKRRGPKIIDRRQEGFVWKACPVCGGQIVMAEDEGKDLTPDDGKAICELTYVYGKPWTFFYFERRCALQIKSAWHIIWEGQGGE